MRCAGHSAYEHKNFSLTFTIFSHSSKAKLTFSHSLHKIDRLTKIEWYNYEGFFPLLRCFLNNSYFMNSATVFFFSFNTVTYQFLSMERGISSRETNILPIFHYWRCSHSHDQKSTILFYCNVIFYNAHTYISKNYPADMILFITLSPKSESTLI